MIRVYVKFAVYENGIFKEKQTPATVLKEDAYGNVTVKIKINNTEEIRILSPQQYSHSLYVLDYL